LLTGRVTTNGDSAEYQYLTVAVDYPTARVAPEALLRLAQARRARGDAQQAISYLERLMSDYPGSEHRAMGAVWLARAKYGNAQNASLCEMLRSVDAGGSPETIEHLKNEQSRVCAGVPAVAKPKPAASSAKPPAPKPAAPVVSAPQTAGLPPTSAGARMAIQIGAFREFAGARSVQRQLERAGFNDVRLVRVPGNQLIRVRVGKFENRAAASELLARLSRANFSAVLVTDANNETPVTN
jgi:cell division septation protein DedD